MVTTIRPRPEQVTHEPCLEGDVPGTHSEHQEGGIGGVRPTMHTLPALAKRRHTVTAIHSRSKQVTHEPCPAGNVFGYHDEHQKGTRRRPQQCIDYLHHPNAVQRKGRRSWCMHSANHPHTPMYTRRRRCRRAIQRAAATTTTRPSCANHPHTPIYTRRTDGQGNGNDDEGGSEAGPCNKQRPVQ